MSKFVWDEAKNRSNQRKHDVSFENAARAFADPFVFTELGDIERGEQRWQAVGAIDGLLLLFVAYVTWDEDDNGRLVDVIRIVSARRATPGERRSYGEQFR